MCILSELLTWRSGFDPFSYTLYDMDGHQVPQQMVIEVGETFKRILEEVEHLSKPYLKFLAGSFFSHNCVILCSILQSFASLFSLQTGKVRDEHTDDLSVLQAISIVLDRLPELRYGSRT